MDTSISQLVKRTAEGIGAGMEVDDDVYFLSVPVEEDEAEGATDDEPHNQAVMVYLDDDGETIIVSADGGACADDIDFAGILRGLSSAVHSRVYLGESDDDGEHLFVEASVLLQGVSPEHLGGIVQEVAELSDWLDEMLFEEAQD